MQSLETSTHIWICLDFFVLLENFSLIMRSHYYQWRAAHFDLNLAIEQWGFFRWSSLRTLDIRTYCRAFGSEAVKGRSRNSAPDAHPCLKYFWVFIIFYCITNIFFNCRHHEICPISILFSTLNHQTVGYVWGSASK